MSKNNHDIFSDIRNKTISNFKDDYFKRYGKKIENYITMYRGVDNGGLILSTPSKTIFTVSAKNEITTPNLKVDFDWSSVFDSEANFWYSIKIFVSKLIIDNDDYYKNYTPEKLIDLGNG